MSKRGSFFNGLVAVVVVAAAIGAGIYLWRRALAPPSAVVPPSSATVTAPAAATSAAPVAPAVKYPISQAQAGDQGAAGADAVPLEQSDASVLKELTAIGGASLRELLLPVQLIARMVATIDALPHQSIGLLVVPLHLPSGSLQVREADQQLSIDPRNAQRYAAYMTVVRAVDARRWVDWYVRHYDWFQQAYRQLGYPQGYFNDRLVAVIDHLLAAPEPSTPPLLVRQGSNYLFLDPALQSLSVGQKLMIRLGPANEAELKDKLRQIRQALVAQPVRPRRPARSRRWLPGAASATEDDADAAVTAR